MKSRPTLKAQHRLVALALATAGVAAPVACGSSTRSFDPGTYGAGLVDGGSAASFSDGAAAALSDATIVGSDGSVSADGGTQVTGNICVVAPNSDNGSTVACTQSSPPNSFSPRTKWTWRAPDIGPEEFGSLATPLVGNFTDDNGDGLVNLCDIPDVLVAIGGTGGKLVMLAGNTGQLELTFDGNIIGYVNPAFGDLDGDGAPEIVAQDPNRHLVAYDRFGHVKWTSPEQLTLLDHDVGMTDGCHAIAIYDLDGDGKAEILASYDVFNFDGSKRFSYGNDHDRWCQTSTAADLDGDGKLEVIFGNAAYHADGTVYWDLHGPAAQPQVANLDGDPDPEVFLARSDGLVVVENNGQVKFGPVAPLGGQGSLACLDKPAAIHDFDGDGIADISASTCTGYGVYQVGATGLTASWVNNNVHDSTGSASTTAFDFLGRGIAQALYGDEQDLWVFDGKTGAVAAGFPELRTSVTIIEYPVVADVDNDQSADIVVVSNTLNPNDPNYKNTVEVFEDDQKRWIPTRRIWNQHAYHVTNVREDGTIPKVMKKSWQNLNTFRTNAQINGVGDCRPDSPNPK